MSPIENVHRASIEALVKLFRQRKIGASARSVIRGARFLTYDIRLKNPTQYNDALAIAEPLALALGVRGVAAYRDLGVIRYDITLTEKYWQMVHYSEMSSPYQIGLLPGNKPLTFNLNDPNQMIVGVPGSGKSEGIKTILLSILAQNSPDVFKFGLIDPHRSIVEFNDSAHLAMSPASDKDEITNALDYFKRELTARKKVGEAAIKANPTDFPVIMLVIDEASEPNVLGADKFPNKENIATVQQLVKEGRKFKLRVLLGTQKPTEADLPGIMSILPVRYVGQVTDARMAANFSGKKEVPAHLLTGNGDFFRSRGDELLRFQFSLTRPQDFTHQAGQSRQPLDAAAIPPTAPIVVTSPIDENETVSTGGRPPIEIDPRVIARYLYKNVTMTVARQELGLSRTAHEKHRDFAAAISKELKELEK